MITGGNRGIGLRIIQKLLECEMTVVMGKFLSYNFLPLVCLRLIPPGVRDPKSAEKSVGEIVDLKNTKGKLIIEKLDVGSLASVREFGKKIQQDYEKLDILINNGEIFSRSLSILFNIVSPQPE